MPPVLAMISGDPTVMGWTICLGYGVAGGLCARRFRHVLHLGTINLRLRALALWGLLAALLLALGLNKQLDLQTGLTQLARALAYEQGWYEQRRVVQAIVIGCLSLMTMGGTLWMLWRLPRASSRARVALMGGIGLVLFVTLRAISFHHLDQWLGFELIGAPLHVTLELGGIACVGLAAAWRHRVTPPEASAKPTMTHRVPQSMSS